MNPVPRLAGLVFLAVAVPAAGAAAAPAGDAAHGRQIVTQGTKSGALPCMVCHGAGLAGNAAIGAPPIAGLPPEATLAALAAIASGQRGQNYVMRNIARSLTAGQRADIAAYLATLGRGG